jgi:hypothetical protein
LFSTYRLWLPTCNSSGMILLITPSARAQDCARALEEATSEQTQTANSLRQAASHLRAQEYSAVVIDQAVLDAEPDESEIVLEHIGTAVPVYVNFAISAAARVVRELRVALHRRKKEAVAARRAAEQGLRNELKGTVTALLLSCEMVLRLPELSTGTLARINTIHELAQEMRGKLGIAE